MNAIGFCNFRSLHSTPDLEIRPITILVGANSSGKSTFLRALPLLRQSVEARKTGPLLWYGRLVDFGSFRETVFKNDQTLAIQLRFSFTYIDTADEEDFYYADEQITAYSSKPKDIKVAIDISGTDKEFRGYASQITVTAPPDEVRLSVSPSGTVESIACNGTDVTAKFPNLTCAALGNIIPTLGRFADRTFSRADGTTEQTRIFTSSSIGIPGIVEILRPFFSAKTKANTISTFAHRLVLGTSSEIITQIESGVGNQRVLGKRLKKLTTNSSLIDELRVNLLVNTLPRWLNAADTEVRRFAGSIIYIGPVRASTQRYYRAQDLAVDEVDPEGENIPMFLQTLSPSERDSLSKWLTEHFNFSVEAEYSSGHVSLKYRDPEQHRYYNLADMGFGFSQILPILVQIWAQGQFRFRKARRDRFLPRIFAIEQPELHLHPRLQAKFADLLCAVTQTAVESQRIPQFVVETHSEAMINRFGALVRDGKLKPSDISVVVFERDANSEVTSMRLAGFDEKGFLKNWPFGFFSPDSE